MVRIDIDGIADLRKIAAQVKASGDKGLGREMGRALTDAVAPIGKAIGVEAGRTMPSGYAPVLTASLRHRRNLRTAGRQAALRLTTVAKGKTEERDLVRLNRGELRHPVFGRSRRTRQGRRPNPWATTKIKPGFYDRGVESAGPEAEKRLGRVLDEFAARLAKG